MTGGGNEKVNISTEEISAKQAILRIREWWSYLRSKWILIICVGLLGGIIGFTLAYFQKPTYKASLSFALEDEKAGGGLSSALGFASQFGIDLGGSGGGAFTGDNLLELMKSRSMVESTLLKPATIHGKNQTLANFYISFNKLNERWKDKPELKNITYLPGTDRAKFTLQQDSVLGVIFKNILKENLSVAKIDKKLSLILVKVTSKNELFSKIFTEVLVKTVSDFYIDTKTKKSVQNLSILQKQTDSVRRELNNAIGGVASSVDYNPNPNPGLQVLRVPSQRRQVDVQANTAILGELVKNLEISKVSLRKETPLIQIIDTPILPLEKERFGKLNGLIAGGFLAGFLTVVFLILKRIFAEIIK